MSGAGTSVRIVTLTEHDLEALLMRAVSTALDQHQRITVSEMGILSPRQVARLAKIRDERVYSAIECGRLEATRNDAGRYRISVEKAREWIASLATYGR